jgi:hypothetical protein
VVREPEAANRKQTFLVCRYVLIVATGALAYFQLPREASWVPLSILISVALVSNLVLGQAPPFTFFDAWAQAPVLVADTALISLALLLSNASQESFLFFFFVLIMAAKIENLGLLGIGAGFIGITSFLIDDPAAGLASPTLMRAPFLFATGIFFGYVVLPERTGQMTGFNADARGAPRRMPAIKMPQRLQTRQNLDDVSQWAANGTDPD